MQRYILIIFIMLFTLHTTVSNSQTKISQPSKIDTLTSKRILGQYISDGGIYTLDGLSFSAVKIILTLEYDTQKKLFTCWTNSEVLGDQTGVAKGLDNKNVSYNKEWKTLHEFTSDGKYYSHINDKKIKFVWVNKKLQNLNLASIINNYGDTLLVFNNGMKFKRNFRFVDGEYHRVIPPKRSILDSLEISKENLGDEMTYAEALQRVQDMGSGWRIPTLSELQIISSKIELIEGNFHSARYWTSSHDKFNRSYTAYMNSDGITPFSIEPKMKTNKCKVRPVRFLSESPFYDSTHSNELLNIVKNPISIEDLEFTRNPINGYITPNDLKNLIDEISDGWRLPNRNEIRKLISFSKVNNKEISNLYHNGINGYVSSEIQKNEEGHNASRILMYYWNSETLDLFNDPKVVDLWADGEYSQSYTRILVRTKK